MSQLAEHKSASPPKMKTGIQMVTPEMATAWLSRNPNNRSLRQPRVLHLAQQMRDGEWALNGESIKFDLNGNLMDGQHRLAAVVRYGHPVQMLVVCGVDADAITTIDTGRARTLSDALKMDGERNCFELAASLILLWRMENKGMVGAGVWPSIQSSLKLLHDNPTIRQSLSAAQRVKSKIRCRTSVLTVFHHLAAKADSDTADIFLGKLGDGTGLSTYDPIFRLREKLIANHGARLKMGQAEMMAITIKAWNYWRVGREVQQLTWKYRLGEEFPEIQGGAS